MLRSFVLGGYHVIRKEAELSYRTSSSVRLWWEFKEPKRPTEYMGLQQTCFIQSVYVRARFSLEPSHARCGYPLAGSAAILCTEGLDVIRKEAWPSYRTSAGVSLC